MKDLLERVSDVLWDRINHKEVEMCVYAELYQEVMEQLRRMNVIEVRRLPELGAVKSSTCVVCPSLPCPHCGRQWNPEPPKRGEIHADNPAPYAVPELVEGDF